MRTPDLVESGEPGLPPSGQQAGNRRIGGDRDRRPEEWWIFRGWAFPGRRYHVGVAQLPVPNRPGKTKRRSGALDKPIRARLSAFLFSVEQYARRGADARGGARNAP